jgi:hypothetical protein
MATRKQLKAGHPRQKGGEKTAQQTLAAEGGNTSLPTRNAQETG